MKQVSSEEITAWFKDAAPHSENDAPTFISKDGTKGWLLNGVLHRLGGPALVTVLGATEYRVFGMLHRVDGPAKTYVNGDTAWFLNGMRHRLDGPAVEAEHENVYMVNDMLHRLDGPAIEYKDDRIDEYYINGEALSEEEFMWRLGVGGLNKDNIEHFTGEKVH